MEKKYQSMQEQCTVNRRDFLKISGIVGTGLVLGQPSAWADDKQTTPQPAKPRTNIEDAIKVPRVATSLPGPFPGRVVQVTDAKAMDNNRPVASVVRTMFNQGLTRLTDKNMQDSFRLLFNTNDFVGIKINPVGAGLISTRLEVVDAIIEWLVSNGLPRANIIIWDRFDYMLEEAGFTAQRYPGIGLEGLQAMPREETSGQKESNPPVIDDNGNHVSAENFDREVYYWADVEGPKDPVYLSQHAFNGKYSYFGKLLTQKLTKIINVAVFKNTGNGISMATKNIGYGAICNTGRLHRPLFFDVCTEVMAFPVVRDKVVLNITDGLRAQYDGGPMPEARFTYLYNTLFFATDAFALDRICHNILLEKRKSMGVRVNEHPMYTDYLRYAQRLQLGITDVDRIVHVRL